MADTQCDYPGCVISAVERCGACGKVYCVRHIQRLSSVYAIYNCDICVRKDEEARRKANEELNKGCSLAMVVTLGLGLVIGGCVGLYVALSGVNPAGNVLWEVLFSISLIVGGLWLLIRLGRPRR